MDRETASKCCVGYLVNKNSLAKKTSQRIRLINLLSIYLVPSGSQLLLY